MDILQVLNIFTTNPILTTLIGSTIGGDGVVLSLGFLSGTGFLPFWIVVFFSIIGFTISSTLWYFLGKKSKSLKFSKRAQKFIDRHNSLNNFLLLSLSKFIYGTRIITIFYLSRRLSYRRFIIYNTLLNSVLISALVFVGYSAGKGFTGFQHLFESLQFWISVLAGILVFILVLRFVIRKIIYRSK